MLDASHRLKIAVLCVLGSIVLGGLGCTSHPTSNTAPECSATCASQNAVCGFVCGHDCGVCPGGDACTNNQCVCTPQCDGKACTDSDGCGGTCGPCPGDISCPTCSLQLVRLSQAEIAGQITHVTLGVRLVSSAPSGCPADADLRIISTPAMQIDDAQPGAALGAAGKQLFHFLNGQLFQTLSDGSNRLLIFPGAPATPLVSGTLATLDLSRPPGVQGPAWQKVSIQFARRTGTLGPAPADSALQATAWDTPLVVQSEVQQ